jgi:hypothetical protein
MDPSSTRHGDFSPASFIHTTFSRPSSKEAFGNWYFQRTPSGYKLSDFLRPLSGCNPTSPNAG